MAGLPTVEHAALSDVGLRRSHNQDAFAVLLAGDEESWRERGSLFLVADGMGAHAVGELASKMAADLIPLTYQKCAHEGPIKSLRHAFEAANGGIHQRGQQNREFAGMGTTSTALVLRPEGAWIAHVGDSRAYRIRGGRVEQLSYDHSLQWELARRHRTSPDEITGVPSNVIVRSLGPEAQVQVDLEGPHPVEQGDTFLLCSDGLSNQVSDQELGAIINALPLGEACRFLVDIANLRGGPDNITVVLARVGGEGLNGQSGKRLRIPWKKLSRRIPWPAVAVTLSILLAVLAVALVAQRERQWSLAAFVVAVMVLGTGLLGALRQYRRERDGTPEPESEEEVDLGPPRVYRQTSCQLDSAMWARLAQTVAALEEWAREKGWPLDQAAHRQHLEAAHQLLQKGELQTALREQCQALTKLTQALRMQRNREEVFQPLWEGAD